MVLETLLAAAFSAHLPASERPLLLPSANLEKLAWLALPAGSAKRSKKGKARGDEEQQANGALSWQLLRDVRLEATAQLRLQLIAALCVRAVVRAMHCWLTR